MTTIEGQGKGAEVTDQGVGDQIQSLNDNVEIELPAPSEAAADFIQPFDPPALDNEVDTSMTSIETISDPSLS